MRVIHNFYNLLFNNKSMMKDIYETEDIYLISKEKNLCFVYFDSSLWVSENKITQPSVPHNSQDIHETSLSAAYLTEKIQSCHCDLGNAPILYLNI